VGGWAGSSSAALDGRRDVRDRVPRPHGRERTKIDDGRTFGRRRELYHYTITARCGGGSLGVGAKIRVYQQTAVSRIRRIQACAETSTRSSTSSRRQPTRKCTGRRFKIG